ncbi:glycerophosphodiester phosphodiesterase [Patulibacter sp. SYSU D01012]|uniref:glycerophosphodiester phosphodiesterase n=1 Tax=Patulibacter sp. SYSU D01012 TaxID=2817381 RepID=UPI001B31853D|nr:glycerophosphodiester phosphodiesterase [Patulibacter sp. SYSU D01012]
MTARSVIAHRGSSHALPDNSPQAFEQAIADGADMIEFDVRRTRDGVLVCHHDPDVDGRPVAELSADELAAALGPHACTLDAVVQLAAGRIGLDVELKEDVGVEEAVAAVRRRFPAGEVVFTSFLPDVVRRVRAAWPAVRTGLLVDAQTPDLATAVRRARACGATAVAPELAVLDASPPDDAPAEGHLPTYVWTVDDAGTLERLLRDPRVTGVITNVPRRALAIRDAR